MKHFKHDWKALVLFPETKHWPHGKRWKAEMAKRQRRFKALAAALLRTAKERKRAMSELIMREAELLRRHFK